MARKPRKPKPIVQAADIEAAVQQVEKAAQKKSVGSQDRRGVHPNSLANLLKWKPGQSGNPAGPPKSTMAMRKDFTTLTDSVFRIAALRVAIQEAAMLRAYETIADPASTPEDVKDAFNIMQAIGLDTMREILDRGHGKAQQHVAVTGGDVTDGMTTDELEAFILETTPKVLAALKGRKKG